MSRGRRSLPWLGGLGRGVSFVVEKPGVCVESVGLGVGFGQLEDGA